MLSAVLRSNDRVALGSLAGALAYALLMLGVCVLACVVPTRRALSIQPTEMLRAEG